MQINFVFKFNMKHFLVLLFFVPIFTYGQFFPSAYDLNGQVDSIVERSYGREIEYSKEKMPIYIPYIFNGRISKEKYDEYNRKIEERIWFKGDLKGHKHIKYKYDTTKNKIIHIEITSDLLKKTTSQTKNVFIKDSINVIIKQNRYYQYSNVDSLSFDSFNSKFQYNKDGLLKSYIYYRLTFSKGDTLSGDQYVFIYDPLKRIIRIEKYDIETTSPLVRINDTIEYGFTVSAQIEINTPILKKSWDYIYNKKS